MATSWAAAAGGGGGPEPPPLLSFKHQGTRYLLTSFNNTLLQVGEITLDELTKYDGRDPSHPLLFAVRGQIFDVTEGRNFYGPGEMPPRAALHCTVRLG